MIPVVDFLALVFTNSIILFASSKLAWINARYRTILLISLILSTAALVPNVGFLLSSGLFFYLATAWLNAKGMEALYMWLMYIILTGVLAMLVLV